MIQTPGPELEEHLHQRLTEQLEAQFEATGDAKVPADGEMRVLARRLLMEEQIVLGRQVRDELVDAVVHRIAGLGPLQPLLEDSTVTEIMVNQPAKVYVERDGRLEQSGVRFRDEDHLRHTLDRIVAPLGRRIDEASPMVDARLPDGSRVNAILPPLALEGPALTIRKFSRQPFTLERLVGLGTISQAMADFLFESVQEKVSILISGGTGAGKTSTLNALGRCIPHEERLITIEDAAELQLNRPHRVALEARPPNLEGKGEVTIRSLVRNALRMRPDRIIVGEVRGGEAFDMLQAMNTGHHGSLTTLHANSPRDALTRLESMVLMAGYDLPLAAIRRMILGAVRLILQQDRLSDGQRVITAICRLESSQGDSPSLESLFTQPDSGQAKSGEIVAWG